MDATRTNDMAKSSIGYGTWTNQKRLWKTPWNKKKGDSPYWKGSERAGSSAIAVSFAGRSLFACLRINVIVEGLGHHCVDLYRAAVFL
jgi:hypothetical protein